MKYLGIDYGTKRIGIARSDSSGTLAFAHGVVKAGSQALSEIHSIIKKEEIEKIVLGESKNFKGQPNAVMENIEEFKKDLEELTGLPVVYEAEFMSSAAAARQYDVDMGRKQKPDQSQLDAAAAAVILQSYLDRQPT